MKPLGCIQPITRMRNEELLKAYRKQISKVSSILLIDICDKIVNSPAPRFWVSEERAVNVVSAIMRGTPILNTMRPPKREMFTEIHRRVIDLKKLHPRWSLCQIVSAVVNSPAPKFYMMPSSARHTLFKIRNGWYDKRDK